MRVFGVKILNTEIMAHPMNWVTVFLMTLIALLILRLLFPEPSTQGTTANV